MTSRTIKLTSLAALCATALSVGAATASAQFAGFGPATILTAEFLADKPSSVVIGDFDGDNRNDLAVTYSGTNQVAVFFNNGDGTFQQQPFTFNVGALPGSIVVGNVDQLDLDGDLDLATANANGGNVSILKNDGSGVFSNFGVFPAGMSPQSMAIGSLNGDSRLLDLVIGNITQSTNGTLSVFLNNGSGVYSALPPLAVTNLPVAVAIADLDGNSTPDAVVVFKGDATHNGGVAVLLNLTPTGGGGDDDLDRLRILMGTWGPEGGGTASDYKQGRHGERRGSGDTAR